MNEILRDMNSILFENQIGIVCPIKNESRYISEWLDYHYRIGVDKFYLYDNDSDDTEELKKILEPWIKDQIVVYEKFPGVKAQNFVYNIAIKNYRYDCRYMAFIDSDEFIFVKTGQTLKDFLDEFFSYALNIGGLAVNWRMFGSNGHEKYTQELVTERFTRRAEDKHHRNENVKIIANPRYIDYFIGPHLAQFRMGCSNYDENFEEVLDQHNLTKPNKKIQINHYYTKSIEEFIQKRNRGRADNGDLYIRENFELDDRNEVEDTGLRDFYRELRKIPLRSSFHDDETRLKNLVTMLENHTYEGMLEKYLTCFHLSQLIEKISEEDRKILTRLSLDGILKSLSCNFIKPQDALLFLDTLPEILKTRTRIAYEIFETSKNLSQSLMYNSVVNSKDLRTYERIFQMLITYNNIDWFLNEKLFTE